MWRCYGILDSTSLPPYRASAVTRLLFCDTMFAVCCSVHRSGQTGGSSTTPSHASPSPPTEYSILFEDTSEPLTLHHEQHEALPRPLHGTPRHAAVVAPLKGSTAASAAATAAALRAESVAASAVASVASVPPTATMSTEGSVMNAMKDVSSNGWTRRIIMLTKVLTLFLVTRFCVLIILSTTWYFSTRSNQVSTLTLPLIVRGGTFCFILIVSGITKCTIVLCCRWWYCLWRGKPLLHASAAADARVISISSAFLRIHHKDVVMQSTAVT